MKFAVRLVDRYSLIPFLLLLSLPKTEQFKPDYIDTGLENNVKLEKTCRALKHYLFEFDATFQQDAGVRFCASELTKDFYTAAGQYG